MDAKFIEERRLFLEMFCKLMSKIKYLWYSEEYDVFIRSTNHDIEKVRDLHWSRLWQTSLGKELQNWLLSTRLILRNYLEYIMSIKWVAWDQPRGDQQDSAILRFSEEGGPNDGEFQDTS